MLGSRRLRVRLWVKLAVFAALGVAITHAIHLAISNRVTSLALEQELEERGRSVARLVANVAADAVLADDLISLHELVMNAMSVDNLEYCLVVRNGKILASSFPAAFPRALIDARKSGDRTPLIIKSSQARYLDLMEPIFDGNAGEVRVGLDMRSVQSITRRVTLLLGVVAATVILFGVIAAFLVGSSIARPLRKLLAAADKFDPSADPSLVEHRSTDEIGELTECFNRMMVRLKFAHAERLCARENEAKTERMAALGTLVAGVAHEVNNPLAGMKNCLRRIQSDDLLPEPKQKEYLELMEEGLVRIEDAMRHLLDYAQPRPLELRDASLGDVLREGTVLLRPTLARRRITLRVDDVTDMRVVADRKQIAQAILNLLLNATYVTSDGGEIRISSRERPGMRGITIEDDGPGVPREIRERIFDPFFSTKPEGEGTGLGLSVTKSIIDAHGGELSMDFPGRGTQATIWLRKA